MSRDRADTMDRLIAAGFAALSREGFDGFGINAVARAAGCDKKLIYRYFEGLDGLLAAMGARVADDLAQGLTPALDPPPATYADLMERLALALLDLQRADPRLRLLRALELVAPPEASARFREARGRAIRDWLAQARGDLRPPEGLDAPALNAALLAAVDGLSLAPPVGLDGPEAAPRARAALRRFLRAAYAAP